MEILIRVKEKRSTFVRFLRNLVCLAFIMIGDIAALLFAFLVAYYFRRRVLMPLIPGFGQEPIPLATQIMAGFVYAALIVVLVFAFEKLYSRRFSFWEEAKHLIKGISLAFIVFTMLVYVSKSDIHFSRATIFMAWLLSLAVFPLFRLVVKNLLSAIGLWGKRVLILGTNMQARLVAEGIKKNKTLGYNIVGFLSDGSDRREKTDSDDVEAIGEISQVEELSEKLGVQDIVIALPGLSQEGLIELVEKCEKTTETIRIVPGIGSLFTLGVEVENLGDVLSLSVPRNLVKPWNTFLKSVFNSILSLIFSILVLPLLAVIAVAIKLDSPGPVLFPQQRLGKGGKSFRVLKFRSMYVNADDKLREYLRKDARLREEWQKYQKIRGHDPRVTRVGKFLRKYSLDELPQILNALKRDMDIVGPRPYLSREKNRIGASGRIISVVRPGMTGLWQVSGRNLLSFEERLLLDEYYIRNWSFWLDFVIFFKTIKVLTKRDGAF